MTKALKLESGYTLVRDRDGQLMLIHHKLKMPAEVSEAALVAWLRCVAASRPLTINHSKETT